MRPRYLPMNCSAKSVCRASYAAAKPQKGFHMSHHFTDAFVALGILAIIAVAQFNDSGTRDNLNQRQYCEAVYSGQIRDLRGTYHEQCYMGKIRVRPIHQ